MKIATVYFTSFLILFANAQSKDENFPFECYFKDDDPFINLEYTCAEDGKSKMSGCLSNVNASEVQWIQYMCDSGVDSLSLYADTFDKFRGVFALYTNELGIEKISLIPNESPNASGQLVTRWIVKENELTEIPYEILDELFWSIFRTIKLLI